MTVNVTYSGLGQSMQRNGWSDGGLKVGKVFSKTIATDSATAANDVIQAITFVDDVVVVAAGLEVVNATTGACNASLGKADGAELMVATAINTTGKKFNMTAKVPIQFDAGDTLDMHFSASAAGGDVIVWALVVDAENP